MEISTLKVCIFARTLSDRLIFFGGEKVSHSFPLAIAPFYGFLSVNSPELF